jgi:coenzyme F420 hydrogenase subunit beta
MDMTRTAKSIAEVVSSGLCIGCGLCEAVTEGRARMVMTASGSLRPAPADTFTPDEETKLLSACPGTGVEARFDHGSETDMIWGAFSSMRYAWAGDPVVRFRAATAGVLTALGLHLLKTERVRFILHVGADPKRPMRSRWTLSETSEGVITNTGSRYGPTAPLAGLEKALDRNAPFAIIAKPCDLSAVHRYAKLDARVDELCVARLAMVCGGQSTLEKSTDLLAEFGIPEDDLTLFRYRGYGNPGPARIETTDGRAFEKTYMELWEKEDGWKLEARCTICPDALGEAADIAISDVWPGGGPSSEDEGFSGMIIRSRAGEEIARSAEATGDIVLGEVITPRRFDGLQPHQVRKKHALAARYSGLDEAGMPVIKATGLRVTELGQQMDGDAYGREREGTVKRVRAGRYTETPATALSDS